MIRCKLCNSRMVLRLSTSEPFDNKFYWICTTNPNCNYIQKTILENMDFHSYYLENSNANSMLTINPNDIATDAIRHYAISKQFNYDYKITNLDLIDLEMVLGFEDKKDFHFWIATQQSIITHSAHNYLPVGSPYYFTFKNLTDCINRFNDNIIIDISIKEKSKIETSILAWTDFFRKKSEAKAARNKLSADVIQAQHDVALKKKAEKATFDIFNAIRRKDFKAIEALRLRGADLSFKNESGLTCIEYAQTFNDEGLIKSLTKSLTEIV